MATRFETLLQTALGLPSGDRARIAAELIASLDGEPEAGVDAAWLTEVDQRMAEAAQGQVSLLDRETVREEIRETLRRG